MHTHTCTHTHAHTCTALSHALLLLHLHLDCCSLLPWVCDFQLQPRAASIEVVIASLNEVLELLLPVVVVLVLKLVELLELSLNVFPPTCYLVVVLVGLGCRLERPV
eukprot:44232-Rhodomonas_salina.1